jgi:type VI secretion system protein ImpA
LTGTRCRRSEEKRKLEPDEDAGEEVTEQTTGEDGEVVMVSRGAGVAMGAIQSRADAIKRLSDIAEFFRKSEPHSPISYLIQRAVKWGNMPLESWLADVISDESVVSQIKQTLGFDTGVQNDSDY